MYTENEKIANAFYVYA